MGNLSDFVRDYNERNFSRFHMPGHKGKILGHLGGPYDITEIKGADSLFQADGLLMELEQRYSALYQCNTVLSAGGSTVCIQAMLVPEAGSKILAARNAHIAFINSCILLDITPIWLYPGYSSESGLPLQPTPKQVDAKLKANPDIQTVYITSPDYMGTMADVEEIAHICHKYDVKLIVDNAHGAHLKFGAEDLFPIALGADFCCSSAHKTLPALTGGAFLHGRNFPSEQLKYNMSIFASTSPSYLILQSLDLCADYLVLHGKCDMEQLKQQRDKIISIAQQCGIKLYGDDVTKLTLNAFSVGMTGQQLADYLRLHKIEPEYSSEYHVVLLLSPFLEEADFQRLECALKEMPKNKQVDFGSFSQPQAEHVLPPRKAAFSPWENCGCDAALGRISAENITTCPPGIPIITTGERISESILKLLKNSGKQHIKVVK